MSARIIPFRDPHEALEGKEREAALAIYREGLKEVAFRACADGLNAACKIPGCGKLPVDDVLPLYVEAMLRELAKSGALPH